MTTKAIVFKNRKQDIFFSICAVCDLTDLEFLLIIKECFTILDGNMYDNSNTVDEFSDALPLLTEIGQKLNEREIKHYMVPFSWVFDYDTIVYLMPINAISMRKQSYFITWREFYEYMITKKVDGQKDRCVSSSVDKSIFHNADFYALENNEYNRRVRISQVNENDVLVENPLSSYIFEENYFKNQRP